MKQLKTWPVAAISGKLGRVKQLITKKNMNSTWGWKMHISLKKTVLHYAAHHGHMDVVEYLVEYGVDTTVKNKKGMTAYQLAEKKEHFAISDYLKG